jgi:hypothetical protein
VTRKYKKLPTLGKSSQNRHRTKKYLNITRKLNLKAQNFYVKPFSKLENTYYKPCFETGYLGENVRKSFCKKLPKV